MIQIAENSLNKIKNNKLLTLMILSYTGLMFAAPSIGRSAAVIAKNNIIQLVMVMPIILAMTSLTKAWIPEDLISTKLGKDSGVVGSVLAFVLGSVSAGPIYAAFPFAKALLDKGASLRNITILLSSWAVIKIPMLANELAFLGLKFMVTRWILTVIAILVLSVTLEKIVSVEDVSKQNRINHRVTEIPLETLSISRQCTGCGVCLRILPDDRKEAISINSGQASIQAGYTLPESLFFQIQKICPRKAIS